MHSFSRHLTQKHTSIPVGSPSCIAKRVADHIALQWHYKVLQAVAMDEEAPTVDDKEDKTVPKYGVIHKVCTNAISSSNHAQRTGKLVDNFNAILDKEMQARNGEDEEDGTLQKTPRKRLKTAR